jgi:thymidylate kinase/predicted kinase
MSFVVLFMGHAASGKTTLASALAPGLRAGLVSTATMGDFVADRGHEGFFSMRQLRYDRALRIAGSFLAGGLPVVLDGTYSLRDWRAAVFRMVALGQIRKLVIVSCECHDMRTMARRFGNRVSDADLPDANANSLAAYYGSLGEFEAFDVVEVPAGVELGQVSVDTFSGSVLLQRSTRLAQRVAALLQRKVAPARKNGGVAVALEGIGGCGKSLQSNLLGRRLSADGQGDVLLCGEFSDTDVGRWIEETRAGRLRVLRSVRNSLATHGLLAFDWLTEARCVAGRADWTVFDSGWRSRVGHMLALPDEDASLAFAWDGVVTQAADLMRRAWSEVAPVRVTIFLECCAATAADRLRKRGESLTDEDEAFLGRLDAAYRSLLDGDQQVVRVDAEAGADAVADAVYAAVKARAQDFA